MTLIDPAGDPVRAFITAPDRATEIALIRAYALEVLAYRAVLLAAQQVGQGINQVSESFLLPSERKALDSLRSALAVLPTVAPMGYDALCKDVQRLQAEVQRLGMLLEQARYEAAEETALELPIAAVAEVLG